MSEHVWTQENIAAHVAGGLTPSERERLDRHVADCAGCAAELAAAQAFEGRLSPLFARAHPGPALEDRLLAALPTSPPRRKFRPLTRTHKILLAAAAVFLFGTVGAALSMVLDEGQLAFPGQAVGGAIAKVSLHGLPPAAAEPVAGKHLDELDARLSDLHFQPSERAPQSAEGLARKLRESSTSDYTATDGQAAAEGKEWRDENRRGTKRPSSSLSTAAPPTPPADVPGPATPGLLGPAGGGAGFAGGGFSPGFMAPHNGPGNPLPADERSPGKGSQSGTVFSYRNKGELPALKTDFFRPGASDSAAAAGRGSANERADRDDAGKEQPAKDSKKTESRPGDAPAPSVAPAPKTNQPESKPAEPESAPRKIIIRNGELEFEIDSFDNTVASILKMVTAIRGAFVATVNSEKLPNGKVRGSVVVRVPPDALDTFVLDLRKELAKTGELKNQRIGSTDITKMYTDLESRLRAARTMEQRLLNIIKDGKGQIKDLLQAEKELGVWRTQIEEIEGELRYYGSLASLSTLTIKLAEKNIQSASAVSESERVQAGIEVEDVEKAYQDALKAIFESKGRVTRSELRQHAAGQFNAILHFDVAHDVAGPLRDVLRQLGTMVRLQIDRVQHAENGTAPPRNGVVHRGNTHFEVSIYNLANIAPRETVVLRVAASDVPAMYLKLRELVAKSKGHVIHAELNEQNRLNIHADLDFHVKRAFETDIHTGAGAIGEVLSRQVNRKPEGDNVTDAKVLFRIALVDTDSMKPRESATLRIAALDVPAAYQKLREALTKAKTRIINASLNEQDPRNVSAQVEYTVRRSEEAGLQAALTAAGETLSRQVQRAPESPEFTDAKILVRLDLVPAGSLPPRETTTLKVASLDVPAAYESLRNAVVAAKGRILSANLNEQDRRNITATLHFVVPRSDETALSTALTAAGDAISRQVTRAAENAGATDTRIGFQVELMAAAAITPRETVTLAVEVANVSKELTTATAYVKEMKGRVVETQVGQERSGQVTARVLFDVPLDAVGGLVEKFKDAGVVRVHTVRRDPQAPEGKLALGRIELTLSNTPLLVPNDQGLGSQFRAGLAFSLRGLSLSVSWIVVGVLFVLPWVLLLAAVVWLVRKLWPADPDAVPVTTAPPETPHA